jgi:adenosylcobinamide-phosphate synthase
MFPIADPSLMVLALALATDVALGELPRWGHPVVWIGKTAALLERFAPRSGSLRQLTAGGLIAIGIPAAFAGASVHLLAAVERWPPLALLVATLLVKSTFALRALGQAAASVRDPLTQGDVPRARTALSSLCSRDAGSLDEAQLIGATVESVAENASDSFVAPLFYYALFGVGGAVFYRAANTLDAMLGYRGHYEYLGKAAARLDDLLNLVPARLTAGLLIVAGQLDGRDVGSAWRILRRDGRRTESPNAGRPMAAMAGLLRVRLEKQGHYQLGDPIERLATVKIDDAWRIVHLAAAIAAALTGVALGVRRAYAG